MALGEFGTKAACGFLQENSVSVFKKTIKKCTNPTLLSDVCREFSAARFVFWITSCRQNHMYMFPRV